MNWPVLVDIIPSVPTVGVWVEEVPELFVIVVTWPVLVDIIPSVPTVDVWVKESHE